VLSDHDDPLATTAPSRQRSRKGRKKGKGKKKQERSRVRQPYINTCLSIPYLDGKFMR